MKDNPAAALPDFDLDGFLPYRMTVAAARLSAGLARQYRTRHGLTVPEWRVLVHLAQAGAVSVRDIERRVNLEKYQISRAASRLEADGLIAKGPHPEDRRLVSLTLTEAGRTVMADLLPIAIAYQERLARRLGPHLAALEAALDTIVTEDGA